MTHQYADHRRSSPAVKAANAGPAQPSLEALRTGAASPTSEQMGHRVDLPDAMREKMESAFGADLSAVKLYESQTVADAGAKAVTQGANIAFAPGMLDFSSFGGQALLGHEMSHVVSQARGEVTGSGYLDNAALEARADREGAMAAAGQTVAMPAAAMSGVTAAAADGPMQAARDKSMPPKPQRQAPPPPAPVPPLMAPKQDHSAPAGRFATLAKGDTLKERGIASTSVMGVDTVGGSRAVVKTGANPLAEEASADMINVAGRALSGKYGGSWDMDAPSARPPLIEEEAELMDAIEKGKLHGLAHWEYKKGSTQAEKNEQELLNTTIYPMVKGRNRLEEGTDQAKIDKEIAEGKTPLLSTVTPDNPIEKNDYFRTMGHVAMMDVLLGNEDRLIKDENYENWLEDTDARQVHLIDNDGAKRGQSMVHAGNAQGRQIWLNWMLSFVGDEGNIDKSASRIFDLMRHYSPASENYTGDETKTGIAQAARALPEMREQLQAQYMQKNAGGPMTAYQQEALDRMEITHEAMTDPKLAAVYKKLGVVGMSALPNETPADAANREELLAERDRLRRIKKLRDRGAVDLSLG